MELKSVIEKRASMRQFAQEPVPVEDLREIVRLAGRAPSVNNSQPWKFLAVTNREKLQCMAGSVRERMNEFLQKDGAGDIKTKVDKFSTFFVDSPALFVVLSQPYEAVVDKALRPGEATHDTINLLRGQPDILSIGAAVQNLLLAATDLGYASCWMSSPLVAREKIESCLNIESPWKIATMVAVGRAILQTPQREKKPLDEIFELCE